MANSQPTIFSKLNNVLMGQSVPKELVTRSEMPSDAVLYSTTNKADYDAKMSQYRHDKLMAYQWVKAGQDNAMSDLQNYTAVRMMYRDADFMDGTPEIGSALDIIADESCPLDSKGKMLHVYSKSGRIKSILEDLYNNRLDIKTWLPMISRDVVKYGNDFFLLNIQKENGVMAWKQLPVQEMDRIENGFGASYMNSGQYGFNEIRPDDVKFVWQGHNENMPYQNWQVAHFRLLNDSIFLPYGTSHLNKARRAWRMWSMMEDAMLIHHLDKSIERRVFKIYVGAIDDADVQAYVNQVANEFKRLPVIDPQTGQVDLRKNFLDVSHDYFIPVRDPSAPSPIETLQGATSETMTKDVEYMQNKVFSALRVPKSFLNFQEAQGKGQNLSFIDVRFARMINRVQQFLLLELQKIGQIHLYLLGMEEEMSNFSLALNNPSSQVKNDEIDQLTKKLATLQTALADPGNGIPMMSVHKALKDIMDMSDKEIMEMFNEIRLEKALAAEIAMTPAVIKQTGLLDPTDRIYGDFNIRATGQPPQAAQGNNGSMDGGPMGGGMGAPMGGGMDDFDLGEPGMEGGSDMGGDVASMGMEDAPAADNGGQLMEGKREKVKSFMEQYFDLLSESAKKEEDYVEEEVSDFEGKEATIKYKTDNLMNKINDVLEQTKGLLKEEEDNGPEIDVE